MKKRNGFVSNSSSSSFILIGISDPEKIEEILSNEGIFKDEEEHYAISEDGDYVLDDEYSIVFSEEEIVALGIQDLSILDDNSLNDVRKKIKDDLWERFITEVELDSIGIISGEVYD